MSAKLVVVAGQAPGSEFHLLTDRVTFGRAEEADVVVFDRAVSRKHIEVFRDGVGYSVRDLNSGNGTFLNGSRIREAELVGGDRIEIGGHTLEFREQHPSRNPTERQVVYKLDKAPAGGPGGPPPQQQAAPGGGGQLHIKVPPKQVVAAGGQQLVLGGAPPKTKTKAKKSGVLVALVFVFGFVFLGLAAFIGWRLIQRHETAEPSPAEVATQEVERGNASLQAMAWDDALSHFNSALQADPNNAAAAEGLNRTAIESRQAALLEEAERHISVGEYVQAIVNLRTVGSESQFLATAAESRLNRLFDELVAVGRSHIDRGEVDIAESFANVVLDASPEHRSALALRDEVQILRGQQQAQLAVVTPTDGTTTQAATAEETPSDSDRRREERERRSQERAERREDEQSSERSTERTEERTEERVEPETQTPPPSEPVVTPGVAVVEESGSSSRNQEDSSDAFSRGWRMYQSGDFAGAQQWFNDYAGRNSGDLASQATDYAQRLAEFAEAYEAGLASFNASDYTIAVHDLRRAYSLDRRLQEHYKDGISSMLADSYYHIAQSDYDGGNYRQAGENARIALRYIDNHQDTQGLVRQLEDRANSMYIEAVSFRESNPERAAQICRDIENMLPEGNDLRRRAEELRAGM